MGCLQNKSVDFEFKFSIDNPSKNQEFKVDLEEAYSGAVLNEQALLSENTPVVELFTDLNDIKPANREDLLRVSNRISRHAIKKISKPTDPFAEVMVDSKFIIDAINSA